MVAREERGVEAMARVPFVSNQPRRWRDVREGKELWRSLWRETWVVKE